MTPTEKKFWDSMLKACNPSWSINTKNTSTPLAEQNVFIYVVNTATATIGAAAISETAFKDIHTAFALKKDEILQIVPGFIAAFTEEKHEELESQCFHMAAAALSQCEIYEIVKQRQGILSGHWIYIYYELKDGSHLGRPVYVGSPVTVGSKFIEASTLRGVLKKVIKTDIEATDSFVSKTIANSGGAAISALLEI